MWCADITYIPMRRGFLYLVTIMDWQRAEFWPSGFFNTMEADFCIEALDEALAKFGRQEIFNTDQGSLFGLDPGITSRDSSARLAAVGMHISMAGRCRWMDNVFIERLCVS